MKVRSATPEDAAAVTALWNRMIKDTLATFTTQAKTDVQIADMITARSPAFWVAETDRVIGFATFGPFRSGPGYAATMEHTVIVDAAALRGGTGSALMDAVEAGARAQGGHVLVAGISSANPNAVAFHQQKGFTQVARMPEVGRKAGQWLDLILMQKTLIAP
jgi:phosphinothricin acetyltransferase